MLGAATATGSSLWLDPRIMRAAVLRALPISYRTLGYDDVGRDRSRAALVEITTDLT
ncbi:MAG: hypothetical protein QOG73_1346 [Acetobacteraceae bacterium]|jgi:hypothetical protein|nr:hypothetical protein [Acetobacteraceae bacterium]MEA2788940.1 hypothetical protein [Acetobacteraceae bacterium]